MGRNAEVERIETGLADVASGRGRFFLLTGEPGIGKTRLCDEVSAAISARGVPVLWGRAWEAGGAPAYWPWFDVLAGMARLLDDATLAATLGDGGELVAELVPEIRARLPPLPPMAPAPPAEARFRLWRTVVALARRAGQAGGLMLVFDDLHSADKASLTLLYALARELRTLRVLLLATCRDVEARLDAEASDLISRLGREGTIVGLPRLDRASTADLVRRRAGALLPALESRICDGSQGNPLFLEEMLRLLDEEGADAIAAGVVPAGVRDVIRQRLDRVGPDARALLDVAAVAGDEIQPALLAAAAGRDLGTVAAQVSDAVRAGIFAERAGRPRFSHSLVREVLYRDLPVEQRRGLHGALGRAIETSHAADLAPHLMELAHHAVEGPIADIARTVDLTVQAATRAVELIASEAALAILERAAGAVAEAGKPPELDARLRLALADTRIRRGEVGPGKALCGEVATLARSLGDAKLLAGAALVYGRVFMFAVVDPVLVDLLEEALAAQPPGDSPLRARLLARLAAALQPAIIPEEPVRIAREAIATARRIGDRRTLLETIHDGVSALMDVVDPLERRALNLEAEALAIAVGDRERLLRTHTRLALDHMALGQLDEADARIDAFEALATELRASWMLWRVPLFRSVRATSHGRFAEAERLEEAARALWQGSSAPDPQGQRALILHREGFLRTAERHEEMRALDPLTRRERANFQNASSWQGIASAITFTRLEDADNARFHLASVPEEVWPINNLFALFITAEPAAFVGSVELVARVYAGLLPATAQCVMLGMTQLQWGGPVARLLGLLAARLERWDDAVTHFRGAIATMERLGVRPHVARTEYEFGRALLQRGRREDQAEARALLESAIRTATELGMSCLVSLAEARLTAAGEPRSAPDLVAPAAASAPAPEGASMHMRLEGEYWAVTDSQRGDRVIRLKDSLGLQYLARLLAEPDREIHVLDLVSGGQGSGPNDVGDAPLDAGDSGELLDDEARAEYKQRLEDLRETLAEAEGFGDSTRAAKAREEIEFLAGELGRAVGLGGRARRAGSAAERARSAVQRRIKNAIVRIGEAAPELAADLGRTVRTGNFCCYRPDRRG